MNIVEPILFQAKINPNGIAICTPGPAMDFVTYAGLARATDNIGHMALTMGLVPGNSVAIYVSETIFHAALVLGLARLGIATVSARTPRLPKELGAEAVITSGPAPFENAGRIIFANPTWMLGDGKPSLPMPAGDEDVCRIMLTSGSTGEAKAIRFTHRNVQDKIARNEYAKGNRVAACTRLF